MKSNITLKRGRAAAAGLAVALLVASCGSSGTPDTDPTTTDPGGSPTAGGPELPPAETTEVRLGMTNSLAAGQFLDVMADELGIFAEYGLEVEVLSFDGDGQATQAIVAGQIEATESSGGVVIASQMTDAPIVMTALNNLALPYHCLGSADTTSADDLRGKTFAIGSLGAVSHAVGLACLDALGLTDKDVTFTALGSEASRISAVVSGAVQAAGVQEDRARDLVEGGEGVNLLADLTEQDLLYATAGLGFRKDWLAENRGTALRLLSALLDAQEYMYENPEEAAAMYAEFNSVELETAQATINSYIAESGGNRGMKFTVEAFELPQRVVGSVTPELLDVDLETVYDHSLLDELDEIRAAA